MQPRMRDAIVLARSGARERGLKRLADEAESLGVTADFLTPSNAFFRNWARASQVSQSYATRWLRKAETLKSPSLASKATQGSLERIGVTESSGAFTAARSEALQQTQLNEAGGGNRVRLVSETRLMKVYDATLDRRTCSVCEGQDGTVVGINESFPAGEPGSVHAFCRCTWQLIRVNFTS